jgi:excinuclease ABC subunit B
VSELFGIKTEYAPCGDQPEAIAGLVRKLGEGQRYLTLLGVTGSGKTFTVAKVIEETRRPALILAPNKTLAAQLFSEMKELFPDSAVEYFVSYYDYYQPEAYVPASDTYIAKDSNINDHIDRMRHAATYSLLTRRDVIIVASVSCIYGLGSPEAYGEMKVEITKGADQDRDDLLRRLVQIQYSRNDIAPRRGTFRARGDIVEIFPAYADDRIIRVEFFGDTIENVLTLDALKGDVLDEPGSVVIFPSSHYVTSRDRLEAAIRAIEAELEERLAYFRSVGKLLEAQRLEMRTKLDLELLIETGTCPGIENYSRHLDGRGPGEPPATLLDYFPKDFIAFIDESHVTMPQVAGMFRGDRARKQTLVDFGFRLPSAVDNRPLTAEEFDTRVRQLVAVSATPSDLDVERSQGVTAEQVIRPTGLVDPAVEVRPARGQVDDLLGEIRKTVEAGHRVLVTSLTKRMCEDLTTYYRDLGLKVKYLHSDIETLERMAILRSLRLGEFDTLVGVNLLREGLDLPEVALVAILDADKEGFLRSHRSLIQTIGRAARNVDGRVILYAEKQTDSIRAALQETERRRGIQQAYNQKHGITPQTIRKKIAELMETIYEQDYVTVDLDEADQKTTRMSQPELEAEIRTLRDAMLDAAKEQRYEDAALLRDRVKGLEKRLNRGF